jgi:hypothetical protein
MLTPGIRRKVEDAAAQWQDAARRGRACGPACICRTSWRAIGGQVLATMHDGQ